MDENWPSYSKGNEAFWKHEWEKHGVCAAPYLKSEAEYFRKTLDLHDSYDLLVSKHHFLSLAIVHAASSGENGTIQSGDTLIAGNSPLCGVQG
jgi:ribonuclease I